ncbi:putative Breast carcinoma amplified sequence 2 (BCAS2) [Monocercomonoides exilis]|uniref:putative Breast carcinoma amplified sequence 2 (BCAS2) n=1 Tax=Monocercomonoides exilis TaxID=2049356 RepID=UPI00355A19AC|nr:putative Breast carcinoma amplified sequence 2 (BCAS2) [Monocercomonoides exilis]|eukprot:MONOS_3506.1-p1 / transcript=MONOS_3506.1 / gene=MONOS_3506 / organism=Monocercomonoides_exilis_PA203 / gene_product=unspecified product / transcript_product=unspecified product / location=Mono_scaffold00083:37501-38380(-) / protein_length=212 / sequence_SO=supercontig / SO=protein_coding / is_pseudo=false
MSFYETSVGSLPYIDEAPKKEPIKSQIDALIAEELSSIKKKEPSELFSQTIFEDLKKYDEDIKNAEKRMESGSICSESNIDNTDLQKLSINELQQKLEITNVEIEHQHNKLMNLFLFSKYGKKKIEVSQKLYEADIEKKEAEVKSLNEEISSIHRNRKTEQLATGEKLKALNDEYFETIKKNLDIEKSCEKLELELKELEEAAVKRGISIPV